MTSADVQDRVDVVDVTDRAMASPEPTPSGYQRRLVPLALRRAGRAWWDGQRPGVRATSIAMAGLLFLAGSGVDGNADPFADEAVVNRIAAVTAGAEDAATRAAELEAQVAGLQADLDEAETRADMAERRRDSLSDLSARQRETIAALEAAERERAEAEAAAAVESQQAPTTTSGASAAATSAKTATRQARVIDGDTIEVSGVKIRLGLVNTPEQGEGCFNESTRFTAEFVADGVTYDAYATDSYGRTVAEVFDGQGRSLNVAIAGSGLSDDRYFDTYAHENPDLARRVRAAYREPRSDCFAGASSQASSSSGTPKGSNPWGTASCHAAYTPCVPPPSETGDLDCADIRKKYPNGVKVDWSHGDPHRLDRDKDGKGCE